MKAKRLTALLLLVVTLIGMLPGTTLAANTPEEALGEIQIFNGGVGAGRSRPYFVGSI